MKAIISIFSFICSLAGENTPTSTEVDDIAVGSVLMIGGPSTNNYEHIELPRMNFIIKKGGIPNYSTLYKIKVVVSDMKELPDGSTEVSLKRKNGKRFFNSHHLIKAQLKEAIAAEELVRL